MKTLFLLATFALITSCNVLKEYDTNGFTITSNTVYYDNIPMAELVGLEFAYDNRKLVKELTFKVLETADNNKINNLIAFLHTKHPEYEIEVEIPFEHIEKYKN
ncbi:MAG: hypothetical protein RI922_584 [Bacteroidota bacterium]|jgi:hypothetical protein